MRDHADPILLSPAGEQRREMILTAALRETRRVRRRRAIRRVSVAAIVPLALTAAIVATTRHRGPTSPTPIAMPSRNGPAPVAPATPARPELVDGRPTRTVSSGRAAIIRVIGDRPDIHARFRPPPMLASAIRHIDDQTLLRTLDESGMQAGLATVDGKTLLYVNGQALR